jgi:hypothetical protein
MPPLIEELLVVEQVAREAAIRAHPEHSPGRLLSRNELGTWSHPRLKQPRSRLIVRAAERVAVAMGAGIEARAAALAGAVAMAG